MMAEPQAPESGPFLKGSILWQKKGPLPVWAWLGLGLLLVLVFITWRRNRAGAQAGEATTGYEQLPGDQTAPPVFIVPQAPNPVITQPVTITVPGAPPGTGRPLPPTVPPKHPPAPPPPGTPGPVPKPTPPGGFVSVTQFPDRTAPREATLWDIAQSWHPSGGKAWPTIWNHPLSAETKRLRGVPERIRRGDRLFVPGKLAKPRG